MQQEFHTPQPNHLSQSKIERFVFLVVLDCTSKDLLRVVSDIYKPCIHTVCVYWTIDMILPAIIKYTYNIYWIQGLRYTSRLANYDIRIVR